MSAAIVSISFMVLIGYLTTIFLNHRRSKNDKNNSDSSDTGA